jgi:PII-like signaling protein
MKTIEGKKITIFTSEEKRLHHRPMFEVIVETLRDAGIAGATVTRGIAGFGEDRKVSTIKIEVLSFNLPVIIEASDSAEKIDRIAPALAEILGGGLMEIMPVEIIRRPSGETSRPD